MNNKTDYFSKQLEYKSNIVGQGFNTALKDDQHLCVTIIGEIVEASGFEGENLFMQWEIHLPEHWQLDNSELLEFDQHNYDQVSLDEWNRIISKSTTQCCEPIMHKGEDGQIKDVAQFCFPFDLQLQVKEFVAFDRFPVLLICLTSLDSWERNRLEGYGIVEFPHSSGFHEITLRTFKPNDDLYTKIFSYFLGGAIKVREFHQLANTLYRNNLDVQSVLNRYSLETESSGDIKIRVNIAIQKEYYDEYKYTPLQNLQGTNESQI